MSKDKSQDYQLIVGYQYQDSTVLRFRRKLNTCDGDDLIVTVRVDSRVMYEATVNMLSQYLITQNDTFRLVWSYHPDDPFSERELPSLVPERTGSRSIHLYESARYSQP